MISIRIVFSKGESLMIGLGMLLEHRLELSHKARLEITQGRRLDLRLSLIGALHVEKYTPQTTCPRCHHGMSPLEIIKGFRADPHDLTTGCPRCKERFQPSLIWSNAFGRKELRFYCAVQTEEMMHGLELLAPKEFEKEHPSIYHSAIAHHGTLKNAFNAIGIVYAFDEIADAKTKIEPFLGKLFDTTIAKLSGIDVKVVRRMRKTAKIPRCRTEGGSDD
jgi:hypothetical protein